MRNTASLQAPVTEQRRRQLLNAAQECIAERGIAKTTTRQIAQRAGVSHSSIAYYFKGRKKLIDAAVIEMATSYIEGIYQLDASQYGPDGPEALSRLLESFVDRNREGPSFVVQIIDAGLHDPELRDVHNRFVEYGTNLVERFIQAGIKSGEYRPDLDPKLAARLIHGVLIWWGSELASAAISREAAADIGRLALELLKPYTPASGRDVATRTRSAPPPQAAIETVRAALRKDKNLDRQSAEAVIAAVESIYALASKR